MSSNNVDADGVMKSDEYDYPAGMGYVVLKIFEKRLTGWSPANLYRFPLFPS